MKRDKIAADNDVKPAADEPVLYKIFSNFLQKNKKAGVSNDNKLEKVSEMPMQMKEDESEGEVIDWLM